MRQNNRTMQLSELHPERVLSDSLERPGAEDRHNMTQQIPLAAPSTGRGQEPRRPKSRQATGKAPPAQPKSSTGGSASAGSPSSNTAYIVKQVLLQTLPKQPLGPRPGLPESADALPASVRDFFDLSATIFNSRALSSEQAIDKAAALDLLARAYSKHVYVVDTIEKAKAKHQKKGGQLPEFTQEEIVDQMVKLAEVDVAKEAKHRRKAARMAEKDKATANVSMEKVSRVPDLAIGIQRSYQGARPALGAKESVPSRKPQRQNSCSGQMQTAAEILERPGEAEAMHSTVIEGTATMQLQLPATASQSACIDEQILNISERQSNMSLLTAQANPTSKSTHQPLRLKSNRSVRSFRDATAGSTLTGPVNFMSKFQNHVQKNVIGSKENSRTRQGPEKAELSGFETNMTSLPGSLAVAGTREKPRAPPRPPKHYDALAKKGIERYGNQTVVIDENTDFLIKNLNNQNFWTTSKQAPNDAQTSYEAGAPISTFDIRPQKRSAAAASDLDYGRRRPPGAWEWDEDEKLHGKARKAFLEMQSRSTIPENNFKLLLKYMKMWKKYMKMAKEKKKEAAKEMELRIQALAHREQQIIKMVFGRLKNHREDQERMRQCSKIVRYQVNQNIKRFYFETMRQKFVRIQRRRYLKKVAKKFYLEQRKCKCLKYWQRAAHKVNSDSEAIYQKITQSTPYAAEVLLEHIAYSFYIGQDDRAQTSVADCDDPFIPQIVKFHFFALKHFTITKEQASQQHVRIRPHIAPRFSSAVELILRQKQYRVLRCLARNRDSMQCFRRMRLFRSKQRYLGALSRVVVEKRKLRFLRYRVSKKLMSTSFEAIVRYWQTRAQLKERYEQLRSARTLRVQARYLTEWRDLWAYYSRFTESTYCYSDGRRSRLKFLIKHFGALKRYWLMRRKHRENILIADTKFSDRYAKICFQNWAWYSLHFCRNARYATAQTSRKYTYKFKREYFTAIKRAYTNSVKCRNFATTRLKQRVIKSLKHRRQFLQLKQTITQICIDKYEVNVLRKSFEGMRGYTSQKVQLKSLEKVLAQKYCNKMRERVVLALQLNVERVYQKKMDTNFLKKLHDANLKRRILLAMSGYAQFRKDLLVRAQALQLQQKHSMVQRYFAQMYLRYCKKNSDRQISANLRKRREQEIMAEKFEYWLRRYRTLRKCEEMLATRVHKEVCSDAFKLWRMRLFQSKDFKFKNRCFLERQRARQLQAYWTAFTETVFAQKRESEMNEAAKWFFWKSKSSIVLRQLYEYADWRKRKRHGIEQKRLDTLSRAFQAMKRKWEIKAALRGTLGIKKRDIVGNIFAFMKQYSKSRRSRRVRFEDFSAARRAKQLQALFEVLRCPQLYKNRDIRSLEVHELFKLTTVFGGWKAHAARAKQLQSKRQELEVVRRSQLLRTHLYNWRYQLYLRGKEQKVVGPRHEERQAKLTKSVFQAWRTFSSLQKQQRFAKDTAGNYYNESLLTKALESLRWNSNQNIHHRNLIEYMNLTRGKIHLQACFDRLLHNKIMSKELKAKAAVLRKKSEALRCYTAFEYWLKLAQEKQIIDNDLDQITALYERSLKAKLFKALYEHRTNKIVKMTLMMKANAHQNDGLLRKAYEALAWYALVHKKKKDNFKMQAEAWRKRKILALWYQVLLKTLDNEGQQVCEVAMTRSTSFELRRSMMRTGDSVPESLPRSGALPVSQDDQEEAYFPEEPPSHQRRTQSQMSFGHEQPQHSKGKSQKSPLTDKLRSLDMPLQLQAHENKKSPPQARSAASDDFDLSVLNTSEELRLAHDKMSLKLQDLLQHTQAADEEADQEEVEKEIAVLKDLISLIKNKYQMARQNEEAGEDLRAARGEGSRDDQVVEESNVYANPGDDSQQVAQDIPSDASMAQEEETQQSVGTDDAVLEERAAQYHISRVKLKVLASIKLFNQQENEVFGHYPLVLARRALQALKVTREIEDAEEEDSLLEGAVNQRKMVKILRILRDEVLERQNKVELAIQHHRCRQVRVVLFALKKHQLVTIMQKTIVQGRLDRLKERVFWEWRVAYARAIKEKEEQGATQSISQQKSSQQKINTDGTDGKAYEEEEAIFQAYLHGASEEKTSSGEKMKQATSKFGSSLQNEYNFDKNLDDILGREGATKEHEVEYEEEDDDVQDIQQFQDFRNISAINPVGNETLAGTKQSFVGLAKLAHGLSGELISEVDLASGLPKLEDFKGEEEEIEKIQAEIEGSEREGFETAPGQGDATLLKTTGNFDFRDFDEEYMRMNSIEKKKQGEKPFIIDGRPRAESEARSEIRSVIREAHGDELGFDADPQPFHGFNDDSDDNEEDSLDEFTRCDANGQVKAVEELDQLEFDGPEGDQVPNSAQQPLEPDSKFLPLQQISEARSIEEATPGIAINKYKQAKFQTRQPQSKATSSQDRLSSEQQWATAQTDSKKSEEFRLKPGSASRQSRSDPNEDSDF